MLHTLIRWLLTWIGLYHNGAKMAQVSLGPAPITTFIDSTGAPLAGGLIYTYAAGTNTPQATYTDSTGTVLNSNPVVLDSAGRAQIWFISSAYKIVVKDVNGVQQYEVDGFSIGLFANGNNAFIGNNTFAGTSTFNGAVTINNGGALNGTFTGNPNFSGSPTFAGTLVANRFQSTVATGTTPLIIASTTNVPNLNVRNINGVDFPITGTAGQVPVIASSNVVAYQNPSTIVASGGYKIEDVQTAVHTVTNTIVETVLYTYTLPVNELAMSQILRIHSAGSLSQVAGDGFNVQLTLYVDGNAIGQHTQIQTYTNTGWSVDGNVLCTVAGAGGTIAFGGNIFFYGYTGVGVEGGPYQVGSYAFDTTAAHIIKLTVTWSGASTNETVSGAQWYIERLG